MLKKMKQLNPNATDTLVGEGSILTGNITSKASLRIEGQVNGDITCEGDVTIGERGRLSSNIQARNVFNAGVIEGSITTKGTLNITPTGHVHGDIHVSSLSIAEGGTFQGNSQMAMKPKAIPLEKDTDLQDEPSTPDREERKSHMKKAMQEASGK